VLVRNQVAELSSAVKIHAAPQAAAAPPLPTYSTPTPLPIPVAVAPPPPAPSASAPPVAAPALGGGGGLSLDTLFGQGALATLLAGAKTGTPVASTSTPYPPPAAIRSPNPPLAQPGPPAAPVHPPAAVPSDPMALMAMLRQSGLLPPPSAPPAGTATIPPPHPPPAAGPLDLASLLAKAGQAAGPPSSFNNINTPTSDIQLKPSSLKRYRPHLARLLLDDLGPPCTQCGRRFAADAEGRRRKTAHMDWHFRVHQRIAEAERRGQHRSWYVDADDWARSREAVDEDYVAPAAGDDDHDAGGVPRGGGGGDGEASGRGGMGTGRKKGKAAAAAAYIPVPEDSRVNAVCPICQEKFEMKWLDEAQEWVWMDAVKVGERAFHASCYGEATKGVAAGSNERGATPARATPEPTVLGKRKAEVSW